MLEQASVATGLRSWVQRHSRQAKPPSFFLPCTYPRSTGEFYQGKKCISCAFAPACFRFTRIVCRTLAEHHWREVKAGHQWVSTKGATAFKKVWRAALTTQLENHSSKQLQKLKPSPHERLMITYKRWQASEEANSCKAFVKGQNSSQDHDIAPKRQRPFIFLSPTACP